MFIIGLTARQREQVNSHQSNSTGLLLWPLEQHGCLAFGHSRAITEKSAQQVASVAQHVTQATAQTVQN
jgi:hypothetical protein